MRWVGGLLVAGAACGRVGFDAIPGDGITGDAPRVLPSCASLPPICGPSGTSDCCESPLVPGGTFLRNNDMALDARHTDTMHPATISDVRIDRYEITIGRFRAFLDAGLGTQASPPLAGTGSRPIIPGSGWDPSWTADLATDRTALENVFATCGSSFSVWTNAAGSNENRPMNCLSWYEAFAFCAWDGGFLPTYAEWSYTAAGGAEQRAYPWSVPASSVAIDGAHASYYDAANGCVGDGASPCTVGDIVVVGSKPAGDGRWGQSDMAGNMWEYVFDYAGFFPQPCNDCAVTTIDPNRSLVSGGFDNDDLGARTMERIDWGPLSRHPHCSARCARIP